MAQQTTIDALAQDETTADADTQDTKDLEEVVESRTYKALTQDMDFEETDSDNPFEFVVYSASGSEYAVEVDPDNHRSQGSSRNSCECMDYNARDTVCKHQRAVALATGLEAVPPEARREEVNDSILKVLSNYVIEDVWETTDRAATRLEELMF
jgi:hypothetical protein